MAEAAHIMFQDTDRAALRFITITTDRAMQHRHDCERTYMRANIKEPKASNIIDHFTVCIWIFL